MESAYRFEYTVEFEFNYDKLFLKTRLEDTLKLVFKQYREKMQHQHGVSDVEAVCIALVYKSTLTYEVGSIFYAISSTKVFGSSP